MTWLKPVDRTSGTLTLSAGTLSCLAHHGTPLSKRCPTTTALEHTIVPMDDAERMPPLGAVKPRQKFFNVIHRALCSPLEFRHERRAAGWAEGLTTCHSGARFARAAAVRDFGWAEDGNGSLASKAAEALRPCTSATPPKADVNSPPWLPPLCAITGLMHCSKLLTQSSRRRDPAASAARSFRASWPPPD
jgi:hypothetical protein